ncbi:MAG: winged helix-turn-helix transcriptional regulator [Candidatus Micrarchaeaceae archaeon]|jgi:DNA-binding Lrp family transcriptional regulator
MINLPSRVKAEFLRLKKRNTLYLEIKHIKNYYFVYQSTSRWDKEKKKPIKIPSYLGRITNDGKFIQGKKKKPKELPKELINTMQSIQEERQTKLERIVTDPKKYKHESKILTALSMNGRIPMSVIGKMIGLKETAVSNQVKKLEKKYDIKYLAEIDTSKLGYLQFLITVKFTENFPKTEELNNILSKEPLIQLVLLTKGTNFDIAICALAENSHEIVALVFKLRTKLNYKAIWDTAPIFEDYGTIQLREEFIELLRNKLLVREYAVLKELSKNGKVDFSEIDRLHNFDKGRSQYSYYRLKEKGIIKRVTISIQNLPIKYIAMIFEDIIDFKLFIERKDKTLKDIISESNTQINKYLLVDDTTSPAGIVLYFPVFRDGDLEDTIEQITSINLGVNTRTYIITSILLGNFCYRNFDNYYSVQYKTLVDDYSEKEITTKTYYEETGRIKKEKNKYATDIRGLDRKFK